MFCPECGEKNKDEASFCLNCGTNLSRSAQPSNQGFSSQPTQPAQPSGYQEPSGYSAGNQPNYGQPNYQQPQYGGQGPYGAPGYPGYQDPRYPQDQPNAFHYICSLCFPIGIVFWLTYRDRNPDAAKTIGIITIVGFILMIFSNFGGL